VFEVAGATPKRRFGKAWRSARDLRAGQSGNGVSREAGRASCFFGPTPERITPVYQDPRSRACFPPAVAKKEEATGVSDAEHNAKARETNKGSLSIFIVAFESGVTHPKEPVISKGGYRDYGPVIGNTPRTQSLELCVT
jgi:hypothetical protein